MKHWQYSQELSSNSDLCQNVVDGARPSVVMQQPYQDLVAQ